MRSHRPVRRDAGRVRAAVLSMLGLLAIVATTPSLPAQSVAQWDFEGSLEATTDHDDLIAEVIPPAFEVDLEFDELEIGPDIADVARFGQGTAFRLTHDFEANGGGAFVNQYTLVLDVLYPEIFGDFDPEGLLGTDGWQCLFQTSESNSNDGDWCVQPDGNGSGIGISGNYGGVVPDDAWHRLVLVVDLVAGTYTSFINGEQVQQNTGLGLDGRFSLGASVLIFADDNGETSGGYVSSIQMRDWALSAAEVAALGEPAAEGVPIPECASPRCCLNRRLAAEFDRERGGVICRWQALPGDEGFRVRRAGQIIASDLGAATTEFLDASPPAGGRDVVYALETIIGGAVESVCEVPVPATFACPADLACCLDESASSVVLRWSAGVNVTLDGYSVTRDGVEVGTAAASASSFSDPVPAPGRYAYELTPLGAACEEIMRCIAVVTGAPDRDPGPCGVVINHYDLDGDLSSSTGGLDLIPEVSPPLLAGVDLPQYSFESVEIAGVETEALAYERGTVFQMLTGLPANGGGVYTNDYTLILDVFFPEGALEESGWAAFYNTNCGNTNDGDWFVRGSDRALGVGSYGGRIDDEVWYRIALVVDLSAGTLTSYIDGLPVQRLAGEAIDGRFSLYSTLAGGGCDDRDLIWLLADDSAENSRGLVSCVQIRDRALSAGELAAMGGASAEGIPLNAPYVCPGALDCCADSRTGDVTVTWSGGVDLPSLAIWRDGTRVGVVDAATESFVDSGVSPGAHVYELRLAEGEGCANLPLRCEVLIVDPASVFFFDDFGCHGSDRDLEEAGWVIVDSGDPIEASRWTTSNPLDRANPPGPSGRPTSGGFLISDSDFGGTGGQANTAGSGMSHDVWSPEFSTTGASAVWLHLDVVAQLNNNGDAVFDIDVSTDDGATWTNAFRRVSPGRTLEPTPSLASDNADGLFGRLHVDLSGLAANAPSVRVRLRHFEPTWDWFIAVDNFLVDRNPVGAGNVELLAQEGFDDDEIPGDWDLRSGPDSSGLRTWSIDDSCQLSLLEFGDTFPDLADGFQLHHFDALFALIDPICGGEAVDEFLITAAIDASQVESVELEVGSAIVSGTGQIAEILLSLDGGATFLAEPVFSYNGGGAFLSGEEPFYSRLALDVPRAVGESNVAFAFHFSTRGAGGATTWWAIDDVRVTGDGDASPRRPFRRGDTDGSGVVQLTDAIQVLNFLFLGGGVPPCLEAGDSDNNGRIELTDGVVILNFLFLGGVAPAAPGPASCGVDTDPVGSPRDLGCARYAAGC